jgi:sigma-B regulation protein RsbU (phosphoserine phosphatase)
MAFGRKSRPEGDSPPREAEVANDQGTADTGAPEVTQEHLQIINRVLTATRGPYEVPEMLELLVKEIVDALGVRWGTIKLSGEESDVAQTMIRRPGVQAGTVPRVMENTAFYLVMGTGEALVVNDLEADNRFPSGDAEQARALVSVPVLFQGDPMGVLTLVDRQDGQPFSSGDHALATYLASEAGPIIKNAQLMEEAFRQRALEHERELAETVWRRFLPESILDLEGFDLAASCVPARQVGGDYYDLIALDDGRVFVVLGDVSGSGMPAALLMSNLQAVLRATARAEADPAQVVTLVNEHICGSTTPERFATLFLGLLDPVQKRIDYVNAGHNPPFLVKPDGALVELEATGIPVGFMCDASFEAPALELESGSRMIIFSDGITEAFSPEEVMFGEERLANLVLARREATSQDLLDEVFQAVGEWTKGSTAYQDDCTLVIVGCN